MKQLKFILILSFTYQIAFAQNSIKGKILDAESKEAVYAAAIYIPDLKIGTVSDTAGVFILNNVPKGNFLMEVSSLGYSKKVASVNTKDEAPVTIYLSHAATEMQEVVVTGVSSSTEQTKNPVPALPVKRENFLQNSATNIVAALAELPGVNQITTGVGISKPVIRGLSYNRVVVLHNGIRQEGQQWGDEHGIEIDEFAIDHAEIIKGPGSIMYGSDAMAGVINFLSPRPVNDGKIVSELQTEYQTNNNLVGTSLMQAGNKNGINWLGRFSYKKAGNFYNPVDGKILNSGFTEYDGSGYAGINRKWGFSQIQFSTFNQKIALTEGDRDSLGNFIKPIALNDTTEDEVSVTDDDLKGFNNSIGIPFQRINHHRVIWTNSIYIGESKLNVDLGWQQNQRREYGNVLDLDATELHFLLNTFNGDVKYFFPERNNWKVSAGVSTQYQTNRNFGEEYLIPEYNMMDAGVFLFAQKEIKKWFFSGGLRFDNRHLDSKPLYLNSEEVPTAPNDSTAEMKFADFTRNFANITGSLGVSYQIKKSLTARLNVSRGFRSPNLSELASNGKHEGTFRYEIGNPDLDAETSLQVDAGLTYNSQHFTLDASAFYNNIQNYIFPEKLKAVAGGDSIVDPADPAPAFKFVQGNAQLFGGEISADLHPHPLDWLHFENSFSYVRGIQNNQPDSMKNLPFMPAPKFQSELKAQLQKSHKAFQSSYLKVEGEYYFEQNHAYTAFGTETTTPGYFLLNAGVGTDFVNSKKQVVCRIFISADNLLNKKYVSHLSRLKYAPENPATGVIGIYNPGINLSIKAVIPIDFTSAKK